MSRQFKSLLDGHYPWGAVVAALSRHGVTQQRLIVYPPGISTEGRRWLRMWRGWPLWGARSWLLLQMVLPGFIGPWPTLAAATVLSLAGGAVAFVMAGDNRRRVRVWNAAVPPGSGDAESLFGQHRLRLLADALETAHRLHCLGSLSAVDYEGIWWQVYDAMGELPEVSPGQARESL